MKSINTTIVLLVGMLAGGSLNAQLSVQLTQIQEQSQEGQRCFHIELSNTSKASVALAGQNYRLYYNSSQGIFDAESLTSLLSDGYTPIKIAQNFTNQNATGYGTLPYEASLGFLNLALDYKLASGNFLQIATGQTAQIAQFCFDKMSNNEEPIEINWADESTGGYATADVELAQKVPGKLMPVNITGREVIQNQKSFLLSADENTFAVNIDNTNNVMVGLSSKSNNKTTLDFEIDIEKEMLKDLKGNYCIVSYVPVKKSYVLPKSDLITMDKKGTYYLAFTYFDNLNVATVNSNRLTNQGVSNNKIYKISKNVSGIATATPVSKL